MEKKYNPSKKLGEDLSNVKSEPGSDEEMNKKAQLEAENIVKKYEENGIKTI